jgi:hypothetical protein
MPWAPLQIEALHSTESVNARCEGQFQIQTSMSWFEWSEKQHQRLFVVTKIGWPLELKA